MKQHMLTHKIRDVPPGFDKSSSGADDTRDGSPDRRSSPDKLDLKRSPPAHPPPQMTHPPPIDMPPMPKRPSGKSTKHCNLRFNIYTLIFVSNLIIQSPPQYPAVRRTPHRPHRPSTCAEFAARTSRRRLRCRSTCARTPATNHSDVPSARRPSPRRVTSR